jgi:hypothetical protein
MIKDYRFPDATKQAIQDIKEDEVGLNISVISVAEL